MDTIAEIKKIDSQIKYKQKQINNLQKELESFELPTNLYQQADKAMLNASIKNLSIEIFLLNNKKERLEAEVKSQQPGE